MISTSAPFGKSPRGADPPDPSSTRRASSFRAKHHQRARQREHRSATPQPLALILHGKPPGTPSGWTTEHGGNISDTLNSPSQLSGKPIYMTESSNLSESDLEHSTSDSAQGADAAELAEQSGTAGDMNIRPEVPHPWSPSVSPSWRKECTRNGAAIASLFIVALLSWVTASQTFVVLRGSKLVHPATLSWPLYVCLGGIAIGGYVFAGGHWKRIPMLGLREWEKPDHRMKYSLWFQDVSIEWHNLLDKPESLNAQVGVWISNGGQNSPIVVRLERMDIEVNNVRWTANGDGYLPLRLLPNQRKRFFSARIDNIPHGVVIGTITYSLRYGPVSGFPEYRRTHRVRFQLREPITPPLIRSNKVVGWTWTELDPEVDIDINPPPTS
jgi:hypothetical protein